MPLVSRTAICIVAIAVGLSPVSFGWTQDTQDLERLEIEIRENRRQREKLDHGRRNLEQRVSTLRRNLIRSARIAQEQESVLSRLESKLPELEAAAAARNEALNARRQQMTSTLAALERLSRNPPQALLLSDAEPLKIVRSAMLLRSVLPHLRSQALALKGNLVDIATVRRELETRHAKIKTATRGLKIERGRLNALILHKAAERRRMMTKTRQVDDRLSDLARRASNLRELFADLRAKTVRSIPKPIERPSRTSTGRAGATAAPDVGRMTQPARGVVVEKFGQDTGNGSSAKGATFKTRRRAQVVAPFDGTVVFSGPFKGYGQILIIQHGDAYHTLLAGMRRVDATLGQRLLAGEPVGVMGIQGGDMRLYVEVRRKGQPVNPLPWFTAAIDKVRG